MRFFGVCRQVCCWVWPFCLTSRPVAGRSCQTAQSLATATVVRELSLTERTLAALDASGQQVVVLARPGQDLSNTA